MKLNLCVYFFFFKSSGGQKPMYVGPQRVPTWLRSTREASHFGVERSSSRFKGLVTRECSLLTSHPVKGMEYDIGLG